SSNVGAAPGNIGCVRRVCNSFVCSGRCCIYTPPWENVASSFLTCFISQIMHFVVCSTHRKKSIIFLPNTHKKRSIPPFSLSPIHSHGPALQLNRFLSTSNSVCTQVPDT